MIYKPNGSMIEINKKPFDYKVVKSELELEESLNGGWQLSASNEKVKPNPKNEVQPKIELEEQVFELKETENKEPVKRRGRPRKV